MSNRNRMPPPEGTKQTVRIEPNTDFNEDWERLQSETQTKDKSQDTSSPGPDYASMGEALRIRPNEEISAPPVCLSVLQDGHSNTFGTLGNFSVLIGKAKSRKTFTTSIALAAALKKDVILNRFAGSFDEDKGTVLYFDTEQGRYHVLKVVKRICKLASLPNPENLHVYSLRSLSTEQRLGFIQWHIYNTPNVGLVVIDGIRDTVIDINDNAEATERVGDLLRWTEQLNIHILTVIHMNKGNDQIRGTIGTELQNKAETVVSVVVDPANKDASIVSADVCRDKSFEPFAFSIDEHGLPFILEDWQPEQRGNSRRASKADETAKGPRTITPGQLSTDTHRAILERAFDAVEPDKYGVTLHRIKAAAEYFGYKFGDNKAKEFITYYRDASHLLLVGSIYSLNLPQVESPIVPPRSGLV